MALPAPGSLMRYLGGKSKLAKRLVGAISIDTDLREIWEPFCGGAAVTVELQRAGFSGVASDIHPALISMYKALQRGWDPPKTGTEKQYQNARKLPDSDPLKAFLSFGCSFGGKEWGGFARSGNRDYAAETSRNLQKAGDLWRSPAWDFECWSFFDIDPFALGGCIYADPPYAGVTGYRTGGFDHDRFWATCQQWAGFVPVYVSEFSCPVPSRVVLEIPRTRAVHGADGRPIVVDRVYKVIP